MRKIERAVFVFEPKLIACVHEIDVVSESQSIPLSPREVTDEAELTQLASMIDAKSVAELPALRAELEQVKQQSVDALAAKDDEIKALNTQVEQLTTDRNLWRTYSGDVESDLAAKSDALEELQSKTADYDTIKSALADMRIEHENLIKDNEGALETLEALRQRLVETTTALEKAQQDLAEATKPQVTTTPAP